MELIRFYKGKDRTIGKLSHNGKSYYTIERPWLDNAANISCIPDGYYKLERRDSPRFGPNMWQVSNVPERSHILIHVANTEKDIVGCIGLAKFLDGDLLGIRTSRVAINEFYEDTKDLRELDITITSGYIT